ncbi:MAG: DegT/DnrJ/EryC1/StrS family aminotransferase [Bdellovibrionales bacterium]
MPRTNFLSFAPPALSDLEVKYVQEVLEQGTWLSSGPKTKAFEEAFKEKVRAPASLALNSCTAGLHLAMVVHRIGKGDEVITTPLTFCATANVVEHVGGTVRLADVEPETLLMDPKQVEKVVSAKTKLVLPVHYAGQPCDMETLKLLAGGRGIHVVEDAAHCMPSKIGQRWIGSSPNLTLFSFYANKNMTTGEGGMMTGAPELLDEARRLALHGMSRTAWDRFAKGGNWKYDVLEPGFKYNMTDMAAALGLAQLERLGELYERRMAMVRIYEQAFKGSKFLRPLKVRPGVQSSYHLYVVLLEPEALSIERDQFIVELGERNIGSSVHYTPVHMLSYYAKKYGWKPADFPNAYTAFTRMVSLPLSSKMVEQDAFDVIEAVQDICQKFAR